MGHRPASCRAGPDGPDGWETLSLAGVAAQLTRPRGAQPLVACHVPASSPQFAPVWYVPDIVVPATFPV